MGREGGGVTEWTENLNSLLGLSGFLYADFHGRSSMSATTFWGTNFFIPTFPNFFPLCCCTSLLFRLPFWTIEWASVNSLTFPISCQGHIIWLWVFGKCGSLCLLLSPLGRSQERHQPRDHTSIYFLVCSSFHIHSNHPVFVCMTLWIILVLLYQVLYTLTVLESSSWERCLVKGQLDFVLISLGNHHIITSTFPVMTP